ncbi:HsdM family class I SAM-dependent methyltransferase [Micromonospora sp. CPCC 206061]|uniref:HsdM family class I SAM-dependent methyltransferase n=1 Tax=Micromonospora sp. CPCC 206061 TaxID=3122410 RepID=UPI002FF2D21E
MFDPGRRVPENPGEQSLMTRAQIAQAAGVTEQAVSKWAHRHSDFPKPIQGDQQMVFPAVDVAAWLDRRKVQKSDLGANEAPGVTYGHRFRSATGLHTAVLRAESAVRSPVARLKTGLWKHLESGYDQSEDPSMYQELVMSLVGVQAMTPDGWALIANAPAQRISEVFRHVWYAQPFAHIMRTDMINKITEDGWWRNRLSATVDALRRHVLPGLDPQPVEKAGRMTAPDAFDFLLDRFAQARHRSTDEYLTPAEVARLMVRLADPKPVDRVHNPCCGSGEILTAVLAHQRPSGLGPIPPGRVSGRALAARTWRLAVMNAAVHGAPIDLGDQPPDHPTVIDIGVGPYEVIVTNPPFKMDDWQPSAAFPPAAWPYGEPPRHNANFAWLQLAATALAPAGRAVVIMPNTTASSRNPKDKQIRATMVTRGAVRCVIELPGRLFRETTSPITLWVLGRPEERRHHKVLLIDGKEATERDGATHRVLTDVGSDTIVALYQEWLEGSGDLLQRVNSVTATAVTVDRLEQTGYDLRAAAYHRPAAPDTALEPRATTVVDLRAILRTLDITAATANRALDQLLDRLHPWNH